MATAGNARSVKAATEIEEIDLRQAGAELREVMSTAVGRSFVMRLLRSTCVDDVPRYVSNAMDLARDNGLRFVGAALLSDIRVHCPELELTMRTESIERARRAQLRQEHEDGKCNNGLDPSRRNRQCSGCRCGHGGSCGCRDGHDRGSSGRRLDWRGCGCWW